jgi:hypothetical protein
MGRYKKEVTKVGVAFKVTPETLALIKKIAWDKHWTITKVFEACLYSANSLNDLDYMDNEFNDFKSFSDSINDNAYGAQQ